MRMLQRRQRIIFIEAAARIHRPERLQRELAALLFHERAQPGHERRIAPIPHHSQSHLAVPFVRMRELRDQLVTAHLRKIKTLLLPVHARRAHAPDATRFLVPSIARIEMAETAVAPVGDVDRAVRPDLRVHGAEPIVGRLEERRAVLGAEGRGVAIQRRAEHAIRERHRGDEAAFERRDRAALVDRHALREAPRVALVRHVLEKAERVRIHQRPVLAPVFHERAALRIMQPARTPVRAGENAALAIELQTVSIPAALGENLERTRDGMVAPDRLAEKFHALHIRRASAPVRAVEPAVRPPCERVRAAVRVFEAEAAEPHFRHGGAVFHHVGNVVAIFVRVKKQVGRIQHPHAATAGDDAARDVQIGKKILRLVEHAVALCAFEDRDAIRALEMIRRRRRSAVEHRAQILVVAEHLHPRRERILEILHDPQPPALIEVNVQRLPHHRFGRGEIEREPVADLARCERFRGRGHRRFVAERAAPGEVFYKLCDLGRKFFLRVEHREQWEQQQQGSESLGVHGMRIRRVSDGLGRTMEGM